MMGLLLPAMGVVGGRSRCCHKGCCSYATQSLLRYCCCCVIWYHTYVFARSTSTMVGISCCSIFFATSHFFLLLSPHRVLAFSSAIVHVIMLILPFWYHTQAPLPVMRFLYRPSATMSPFPVVRVRTTQNLSLLLLLLCIYLLLSISIFYQACALRIAKKILARHPTTMCSMSCSADHSFIKSPRKKNPKGNQRRKPIMHEL